LYLASELDREGKAQAAAGHYNTFLEKIARQPAQNRPQPAEIIAVVLRMADCQARASQTELAIKSYRLAEKLAAQTGQSKLESLADVNEAALQAKTGRRDEALRLYQNALQLDDSAADRRSAAEDWFTYGRFLDEAGFSARLVYACYVKSETLARSAPEARPLETLGVAQKQAAKRIGATAAALRRDPEPALREALALRR
jgi:tetratricopeptide (TPR) repeat protein